MKRFSPVAVRARRGAVIAVAVAIVQLAAFANWSVWAGSWAETERAMADVLFLTVPAAAAMAAWVVPAERRRGLGPMLGRGQ